MILLRQYFLVKTQISWPNSEVDAALACGPLVVAQLAEVGEDGEQLEVKVGVGGWSYIDSLAILGARLNIDYRLGCFLLHQNHPPS